MKDDFDGFITRLDIDEERINEIKDMPVETSITEIQRE